MDETQAKSDVLEEILEFIEAKRAEQLKGLTPEAPPPDLAVPPVPSSEEDDTEKLLKLKKLAP